jgi:hypothetical protein
MGLAMNHVRLADRYYYLQHFHLRHANPGLLPVQNVCRVPFHYAFAEKSFDYLSKLVDGPRYVLAVCLF